VLVDVVVVVVSTGDVLPDVLTAQLGAELEPDVQLIVDPVLNVLLVQTDVAPSVAVQLPVELLLDTLDPELVLLKLEVQVVMAPLPDVVTMHPGGVLSVLGVLPELLELDDPLLLELDDPLLLELDDPLLLELDEPLPELAEPLLVEPDELSLADTELSWARATCTGEVRLRPNGSAVAPVRSSTATGRAIRRAGENCIRSFMRNLAVKPFHGSVRTV